MGAELRVWRAAGEIVRAAAQRAGLTDRGAAVHVVQHTLGHASLATTRYVHVQPGESSGHSRARLSSCVPQGLYSHTLSGPSRKWLFVTATAAQGAALLPDSQPAVASEPPWSQTRRARSTRFVGDPRRAVYLV